MSLTVSEVADLLEKGDIAKVAEGGQYFFLFHKNAVSPQTCEKIRDGAVDCFGARIGVIRYDGDVKPQLFKVIP